VPPDFAAPPDRATDTTISCEVGIITPPTVVWAARRLGATTADTLPPAALAALGDALDARIIDPGHAIRYAGEAWIMRSGYAVRSVVIDGQRRPVALLRAGDIVGELGVLARIADTGTVEMLTYASCLVLPQATVADLLDHPEIVRLWLTGLARRSRDRELHRAREVGATLIQRAAWLLLAHAQHGRVPVSQEILAQILGVSRPSLNRSLRDIDDAGAIRLRYRDIQILDADRLAAIAHSG